MDKLGTNWGLTVGPRTPPPRGGRPLRTCVCIDIHLECVWVLELGSLCCLYAPKVLSSITEYQSPLLGGVEIGTE